MIYVPDFQQDVDAAAEKFIYLEFNSISNYAVCAPWPIFYIK